jgi:hypothetical protein
LRPRAVFFAAFLATWILLFLVLQLFNIAASSYGLELNQRDCLESFLRGVI